MLAIIGGRPERFRPLVDLYRRALAQYRQPTDLPVGVHVLGYVAASDEEAAETQWPYWLKTFERGARERGWTPPTRAQFEAEVAHGAMFVGSPETVAQRTAEVMRALDLDRYDLHYAIGAVPFQKRLETIELLGREVFPRVRELLAAQSARHEHVDGASDLNAVKSPVRSTHAPVE
jgi:alkanesulfonate monooxygenase SsuD/methylene tetrahydromethanopterin reductase-like flavin-dependent oxidoreductase (luciferase family)